LQTNRLGPFLLKCQRKNVWIDRNMKWRSCTTRSHGTACGESRRFDERPFIRSIADWCYGPLHSSPWHRAQQCRNSCTQHDVSCTCMSYTSASNQQCAGAKSQFQHLNRSQA
jgi:hypothetical protein